MFKVPITKEFANVVHPPSPLRELTLTAARDAGVTLYLKREDLLHPEFGGNKWRKLKYNVVACLQHPGRALLTFGGAYSNHLAATAAAGALFGIRVIGVVRGEADYADNATLSRARALGMHLHFVDRATYRRRHDPEFFHELRALYGDIHIVPEGGSNHAALLGVAELVDELRTQLTHFDVVCCPVGSGGTLAGIAAALRDGEQALGFAVLRDQGDLDRRVDGLLQGTASGLWTIDRNHHGGGYARVDPALGRFCEKFEAEQGVPLEPIYTGKMMQGILACLDRRQWPPGTVVVALHTGGLQGRGGLAERAARKRASSDCERDWSC